MGGWKASIASGGSPKAIYIHTPSCVSAVCCVHAGEGIRNVPYNFYNFSPFPTGHNIQSMNFLLQDTRITVIAIKLLFLMDIYCINYCVIGWPIRVARALR